MPKQLEQWQIDLLKDYIGEEWGAFESFCETHGFKEGTPEEVYEALGGEN